MTAILPMKAPDPRKALIDYFNEQYLARTGRANPVQYGGMMKMLEWFWHTDEDTGEIFKDYPDPETWAEQVDGFFRDEFAGKNRGFHFSYLVGKNWGSFKRYVPGMVRKRIVCRECGREGHEAHQCPNREAPADPAVVKEALAAIKQLGQSMDIRRGK